ncbi:hypothetical protein HAX54_018949, partial [Datura stramonium]|nr:hypothetical protein [Datura stramonium]
RGRQTQSIYRKSPSDHESKDESWYPMKTHYNVSYLEFREFVPEALKGHDDSS